MPSITIYSSSFEMKLSPSYHEDFENYHINDFKGLLNFLLGEKILLFDGGHQELSVVDLPWVIDVHHLNDTHNALLHSLNRLTWVLKTVLKRLHQFILR